MNHEETKELYEQVMGNEDRNNSNWDKGQSSMLMSMEVATMDFVKDMKPGKVLSIGCGNGREAFKFAEWGWTAHGIDASKTAIRWDNELAKKLNVKNINFTQRLIEEVPDEEIKEYDVIEMGQTLEHIPDENLDDVMRKISLCPVFIGSVPLDKHFAHEATHVREFSEQSLKEFLEQYYPNVFTQAHAAVHDWDKPNIIIFKATK